MTEHTISPWLRWQTLFVLFHYLFSLLIFSLPAHALHSGESGSPSNVATTEASPLRDQMAQFWGSAQQSNASDAARGVAGSVVNSALTAEVEDWLKLGGAKAKVTLDTGISGSHHRDIGLDYFLPLLDTENSTLFTQLSFHRWNERNQINVGLGYRHDLNDHWMAGGNLFYDRDLSRHHNRLGVGGELWGEGLRTAVNYYHPLSDWRLSHDNTFNDDPLFYDLYERAARGWDLSVEAAISQHVGVKGTWFQWYGDKVDVTGARSQASRDPRGVTLGANWQPVPLLAFNAEHSVISGQDDDTRLGLNLNWQFGRNLAQMLDPSAASALSSLKGARHDFVNRNNNIVLAYQQREKDLHLYFEPTSLTTKAGSTPFTHTVKGGRGGFIVYHSNQPDIAQVVSEQAGTVAPLKRGEVIISAEEYQDASRKKLYDRAEYRLTIQPGDFAPSVMDVRIEGAAAIGSTLTGSYTWISNEGEDEGKTAQRWYRQHAPEEVLSTSHQYQQTAADVGRTLVYEVTPVNKAGLRGQPGSAQQDGPQLTLNKLEMTLVQGGGEQQANGQIKFKAGETGMLLFEATVLDQDGKPVADQPVYWSHNNPNLGKLDETRQMTNSKGQSLVKFSDITHAGDDTIVASLLPETAAARTFAATENPHTKILPLSINFSSLSNVTFINPPQQVTVGTNTDFTVLVTDDEHQPLENVSLQITSQGDTRTHVTGKDGKATFTLTAPLSTNPVQWTVSAVLTENSDKGDTAQIGLLADSTSAQVTRLIANPSTAVVGADVVLTASVRDKHGNPVSGAEVTFLSAVTDGTILAKHPTDEKGVATFPDYSQTVAQEFHPAAQVGAGPLKATTVTFTADKVKTLTLQRNFSGELLADGSTVSWTATAKDAHNNPVPEAALLWNVTGPTGKITPEKDDMTNDKGEARVTFALPQTEGNLKVEVASGSAKQQDNVMLSPVLMLASLEPSSNQPLVGGQVTLTARVTNLAGDPLENVLVDFTNNQNARMTEKSGVRTDSNGLAQAALEIVKGQEQGAAGKYEVKATLLAKPSEYKTTTISWQIDNAAARVTQLNASPSSAAVGSKVQLTATVQDTFGNPVKGAQVEFLSAAANGDLLTTLSTNDQGVVTYADYSQKVAGSYHPAARVIGGMATTTRVTFNPGEVKTLELQPDFTGDLQADGSSQASWTVTAQDAHGNPVPDAALSWDITGPTGKLTPTKDDETNVQGKGLATVTLPGEQGELKVLVTSGNAQDNNSVTLLPVLKLQSLVPDTDKPVVGGSVTLTAKVVNQAGTALANVMVNFTHDHADVLEAAPNVKTDNNGEARATLKIRNGKELGAPGNYVVKATLQDKTSESKQATLTWLPGAGQVMALTANPTSAKVGTDVELTATVQDPFGNKVPNAAVNFLDSMTGSALGAAVNSDAQGVSTFTYQQPTAGAYRPAARVGNSGGKDTPVSFWGTPSIESVIVSPNGRVASNTVLTATPQGFDAQGTGEDDSKYQWYYRRGSQEWQQINKATDKTFAPTASYIGLVVRAGVKPKGSQQIIEGDEKYSAEVFVYGTPSIESVSVTPAGFVQAGATLTAAIKGFDAQGTGEERSTYQWYYRQGGSTDWKEINGATGKTFPTLTSNAGVEIRVVVTPKGSLSEVEGVPKESNAVQLYGKPTIGSVQVTPHGSVRVNNPLTATWSDFNANGTGEDASQPQWYYRVSPTTGWIAIDKANGKAYRPDNVRIGQQVRFGVTPKGSDQTLEGAQIYSDPISVYSIPSIESVSISPSGSADVNDTLNASHEGFKAEGTGADDSRYQWYSSQTGSGNWQVIDNAIQTTFTATQSFAGLYIRVGVTPKGRDQDIKGTEKWSNAVTINSGPPALDESLIEITYTSSTTTVVNNKFHTDFTVTAKQKGHLMPNVPICMQFIDDIFARNYQGVTGSNGINPTYIEYDHDYAWLFVNLKIRYAYCKGGNPAAADFSKNPWIPVYNG